MEGVGGGAAGRVVVAGADDAGRGRIAFAVGRTIGAALAEVSGADASLVGALSLGATPGVGAGAGRNSTLVCSWAIAVSVLADGADEWVSTFRVKRYAMKPAAKKPIATAAPKRPTRLLRFVGAGDSAPAVATNVRSRSGATAAASSVRAGGSLSTNAPSARASRSDSQSSDADWKRSEASRAAARAHQRSKEAGRSGATEEGTGSGRVQIESTRSPKFPERKGS